MRSRTFQQRSLTKTLGIYLVMLEFEKLKNPWGWVISLIAAWTIGLATSAFLLMTVVLWQTEIYPPSEVQVDELLASTGFIAWLKYWSLSILWVAFYGIALFSGALTGPKFYTWITTKFDLLRWKNGTQP